MQLFVAPEYFRKGRSSSAEEKSVRLLTIPEIDANASIIADDLWRSIG